MMTTLVKFRYPEFESMERRLRRVFDSFPIGTSLLESTTMPAADVYETPTEFVVELEIPGFDTNELSLDLSDHTLTVKGARAEHRDEAEKTFRMQERLERTFERTFPLPAEVDADGITASFEQGVLKVHAPKLAAAKQREITISS
jgi:HSP20 family protein